MLYLVIKSVNIDLLNYFCERLVLFIDKKRMGFNLIKGPIFFPKEKKFYRVTRSSHVFSRSKEEFGIVVYKRLLILKVPFSFSSFSKKISSKQQLKILKKYITNFAPAGISLKLSFKDI